MRLALLGCTVLTLLAQGPTDLTRELGPSRQRIDAIDDQIVKLLNERALVVRDVGLIKKRQHAPAEAPERYEQVLRRIAGQARPPLAPDNLRRIYETIIAEMTAMEKREMEKAPADR